MGTRRSRHNKGRKVEGQHDQIQTNCALCLAPVMVPDRNGKRHLQVLCSDCTAGSNELITFPKIGAVGASMVAGFDKFLRCQAVKDLQLDQVIEMSDLEARQAFTKIRFSESNGIPECPPCGSSKIYPLRDGEKWRCAFCAKDFSLTTGTIFSSRKLSYRVYLSGLALMMNGPKGISVMEIGKRLGLQYKTIYQLAVDLRTAMQEPANENIPQVDLEAPKYQGGGLYSTFTRWSREDTSKLIALCNGDKKLETASVVLGRAEKSIAYKARDLGLVLPSAWKLVFPHKASTPREKTILLQYPYIIRPRDEHAQLLAVNALIPKGMPSESRADIVQEIILAILEGKVTIEDLKKHKENLRAYIRNFNKMNYQPNAISLSGYADDDREYYDIASAISRDEWKWSEMNEARSAKDAITKTHQPPTQFSHVSQMETRRHQQRSYEKGINISFEEAAEEMEKEDFIPIKPLGSGVSPLATSDILERFFDGKGLTASSTRSQTGSFYLKAHFMTVRISDHPHHSYSGIEFYSNGSASAPPDYEWRTDLNAGFRFKVMKYQTLKELADDFLADCMDAGFVPDEEDNFEMAA